MVSSNNLCHAKLSPERCRWKPRSEEVWWVRRGDRYLMLHSHYCNDYGRAVSYGNLVCSSGMGNCKNAKFPGSKTYFCREKIIFLQLGGGGGGHQFLLSTEYLRNIQSTFACGYHLSFSFEAIPMPGLLRRNKVTIRHVPCTTTFEEKGEPKRNRTDIFSLAA